MKFNKLNIIKYIFPILLVTATIFMSIGYASINSITTTVSGNLMAQAQEGVFIRNVTYTPFKYRRSN